MFPCMETHTFPLADEEKQKLEAVASDLRNQPILNRAQDFFRGNPSWILTGAALVGLVATCLVTRLLGRR